MKQSCILLALIVAILGFAGCTVLSANHSGYIYEDNAVMIGGDGKPIELVNNLDAINCTFDELVAFIKSDATDQKEYFKFGGIGYVCADFAEDLHNNAEMAGIRAAWVSIDIQGEDGGHACNAFETSDKGLVFVDCTGGSSQSQLNLVEQSGIGSGGDHEVEPLSHDSIAYVEVGKEYGVITIDKAQSPSYDFYQEYAERWQDYRILLSDYEDEVARYNQEIDGKTYYKGSLELARIEAWETRIEKKGRVLDELSEELGYYWSEPLGIVDEITIHW